MEEAGGSTRRRAALERDWTQGSIVGNLWSLSWPMIVTSSFNIVGPTIDMIWVGKLGAASIAGVGVAGMGVQLVNMAIMGLVTGVRALVARFVGVGDTDSANHVSQQAFVISAGVSTVMVTIGIFLAEPILTLLGVEPDVVTEGTAYMRIMFVGAAAMSFRMMSEGIMQASGDAITPMRVGVFFRFFHVALCPFLIFGWWIFPRMGVSGAALTNVMSQGLGLALLLWILFTGRTRLRLTLRNFHLDFGIIWRAVKVGIPAAVMNMQMTIGHLVLMWIIVRFGTLAVAAHTVCQRVEGFVHMPSQGFGMAAGVLAGQNLGSGQPERAARSGWLAMGLVEVGMVIGSVAILLWAESLVRVFNPEPGLVEITSNFLRIATAGFLFFGVAIVVLQCLNGAGDTIPTMIVALIMMWVVQLPLAYFLPQITDLGVYGVRWAMVASFVWAALAAGIYFRLGRWKRKTV